MKHRQRLRCFTLACMVGIVAAPIVSVSAQEAGDIVESMFEVYKERMAGIENYTITTEVRMGSEENALASDTDYRVKEMVEGFPVFKAPEGDRDDQSMNLMEDGFEMYQRLKASAKYAGMETVEGTSTHVLLVDDPEVWEQDFEQMGEGEAAFTLNRLRFYIDPDAWVIRQLNMEGAMEHPEGSAGLVSGTVRFQDYRDIDGMVHPFRTEMTMEGLNAMLTLEQRAEAEEAMAAMEEQLKNVPENQRALVEGMLKSQMEQFRQVLENDQMVVTTVVTDLVVNAGPPE